MGNHYYMSISTEMVAPIASVKRSPAKIAMQFLRFCIVGGLNTGVDLLAFNILIWMFPTQDSGLLVIFNSLAYSIGAINSFCWNKIWTFRQHSEASSDQFVRFALVTSLGIICNDAFLWLATSIFMSLSLTSIFWVNVAKVLAIAGSVTVSYIGMRFG